MDIGYDYTQEEIPESNKLEKDGDNNTNQTNIQTDETAQKLQELKDLIDTKRVAQTVDPEGVNELYKQINVNEENRRELEQ